MSLEWPHSESLSVQGLGEVLREVLMDREDLRNELKLKTYQLWVWRIACFILMGLSFYREL